MKRTAVSPQHLRLCRNEYSRSCSSLANTSQGGWKHFFVIAFNSMLGVAAVPLLRLRLSWGKLPNLCHGGFCAFKWQWSWCDSDKTRKDAAHWVGYLLFSIFQVPEMVYPSSMTWLKSDSSCNSSACNYTHYIWCSKGTSALHEFVQFVFI